MVLSSLALVPVSNLGLIYLISAVVTGGWFPVRGARTSGPYRGGA